MVVKNTFIDDFANDASANVDPAIFRSVPAELPTLLQRRRAALDLTPIREGAAEAQACLGGDTKAVQPDIPAAFIQTGEWLWPSDVPRRVQTPVGMMAFGKPPGLLSPDASSLPLRVRNTFIDLETAPAMDDRAVRSMPHGMFSRCLHSEMASGDATLDRIVIPQAMPRAAQVFNPACIAAPSIQAPMALAPGTEVVIEGLVKSPAFNGQHGSVQSFDMETGRYNILLAVAGPGHHRWAKVKRDNLQLALPPPPPSAPPSLMLGANVARDASEDCSNLAAPR